MMPLLKRLYTHIKFRMIKNTERLSYTIWVVSWIGGLGYPLYFYIWTVFFPQNYESAFIRFSSGFFCLVLLSTKKWPHRYYRWLPTYWHALLTYILPFCFTYLLLKNNFAVAYHISLIMAICLIILFTTDWILSNAILLIGGALGFIVFYLMGNEHPDYSENLYLLPLYLFAVFGSNAFMIQYSRAAAQQDKLEGMLAASSNLAHELRTPLLSIRSGAGAVQKYLPDLMESHRLAIQAGVSVPEIRGDHLLRLRGVLTNITSHTQFADAIINHLLSNAQQNEPLGDTLTQCSIQDTLDKAMAYYPFKSEGERALVHLPDKGADFVFWGTQIVVIQVLFNLLRNALYAVAQAEKGEVFIDLECSAKANILRFRDTGAGMDSKTLARVFERFYTTKDEGTGIGLSFCRSAMERCGGTLTCHSELGQYTEFVLTFPNRMSSSAL